MNAGSDAVLPVTNGERGENNRATSTYIQLIMESRHKWCVMLSSDIWSKHGQTWVTKRITERPTHKNGSSRHNGLYHTIPRVQSHHTYRLASLTQTFYASVKLPPKQATGLSNTRSFASRTWRWETVLQHLATIIHTRSHPNGLQCYALILVWKYQAVVQLGMKWTPSEDFLRENRTRYTEKCG
jgi:hypothetical protein